MPFGFAINRRSFCVPVTKLNYSVAESLMVDQLLRDTSTPVVSPHGTLQTVAIYAQMGVPTSARHCNGSWVRNVTAAFTLELVRG